MTFAGEFDLDIADQALRQTLERHRLAIARVDQRQRHWVFDSSLLDTIRFEQVSAEHVPIAVPINVATSGTAKFLWQPIQSGFKLHLVNHHAAADGLGGLQFVLDWMASYHNLRGGVPPVKLRDLDQQMMLSRNQLDLMSKSFLNQAWLQPIALFGATKFMFRRIAHFGSDVSGADSAADPVKWLPNPTKLINICLNQAESETYRQLAEKHNRTINDFLLRDLFLAMHDFRKEQGIHRSGEWLRIIVPMSIRTFSDRRMPSVNRATIVQLDRSDKQLRDAAILVDGVSRELRNIKDWRLDKTFLLALRFFSMWPGLLKRVAQRKVCRATTILTNLGAPFDRTKLPCRQGKIVLGGAVLEDFELIAPLRPLTPVAFAASRYADQLKLSMHYHPVFFSVESAELLSICVRRQLQQTMAAATQTIREVKVVDA